MAVAMSILAVATFLLWSPHAGKAPDLGKAGDSLSNPILRIDLAGHSGAVNDLRVDAIHQFAVTASSDKTLRIWSLPSGRLTRVIRPPIGSGPEGELNVAAISPDGNTIACGGWTGASWGGKVSVYLFDRASGQMIRRIGGLPDTISSLDYSKDGSRLAVGVSNGGLFVFSSANGLEIGRDSSYTDRVMSVNFDSKGKLATSSVDGYVRLYDSNLKLTAKIKPPSTGIPTWIVFSPGDVRFSPDESEIAVGDLAVGRIGILSAGDLHPLRSLNPTGPTFGGTNNLCWSPDGQNIYAGGTAGSSSDGTPVFHWAEGAKGVLTEIFVPGKGISGLEVAGADVIYATSDGQLGIITNDKFSVVQKRGTADLGPHWFPSFLTSSDGDTIRFRLWTSFIDGETAQFSVAGRQLQLEPKEDPQFPLTGPVKIGAEFQLEEIIDSFLNVHKLNGHILPLDKFEDAISFAVMPDRSSLITGATWHLYNFDPQGKKLWSVPVAGIAQILNVTPNGKLVIAANGDGTIRWYRADNGHEILAYFPHPDKRRWVAWTPGGYFDCSPGGEDLIGWHVNNGIDKAADFYSAGRFRGHYYRPDVIANVLSTLDEAEAVHQADSIAHRPDALPVEKTLPPVVRILGLTAGPAPTPRELVEIERLQHREFEHPTQTLSFKLKSVSEDPILEIQYLVDGRPAKVERGLSLRAKDEIIREVTLDLPEHDVTVSVIASNKHAASEPASISLHYKALVVSPPAGFTIRPKLYVLAIGVGTYADNRVPHLKFPGKDATDFSTAMLRQKELYADIQVHTVTDAEAPRDRILDELEWIQKATTHNDVAMIFLSGHGDNDANGNFIFLPANFNQDHVKSTSIGFQDIRQVIEAIPGKVLFFVDACHSGNVLGGGTRKGVPPDINGIVNELASAENGAIVFAASTGKQAALEDDTWGNGAFTKALIECLSGKDDHFKSGRITVNMLDLSISERVKALTKGGQTPTTAKPKTMSDFPIAIVSTG